jgi:hypothetical protein
MAGISSDLLLQAIKTQNESVVRRTWEGVIGDTAFKINAKPITPKDMDIVNRKYPNFMTNGDIMGMCCLIALKAENDEGEKMFNHVLDTTRLATLDINMIGDMFQSLFDGDVDVTIEETEKNSEAT